MMCLVPSKELDPFASLRGQGVLSGAPKMVSPPKASKMISSSPATKAPVVTSRALRRNREIKGLKADASTFFSSPHSTHSRDSNNELLSGFPSADTAPRASSSTKASVVRREAKSKTTVKVVEDSTVSDPPLATMVYKRVWLPPHSRKITSTASKGKARQVVITDDDSASNKVESEDEDEEEDIVPPPKRLKTTSSISGMQDLLQINWAICDSGLHFGARFRGLGSVKVMYTR
ncbi:hypothetical protein F5876DRAFT_84194 [Lentinula aff. lateritia]|uniref:Uncharacterized protein n=1 Tax=Lentinula aff. lateritia TaxID=2804960 RepID=A0ACC1TGP8_9AGAR|nr:hypothetical protein F5876DRAFT_84194 [Lentinula aff. lateritia]